MTSWQLQHAKNRFSEVVDRAREDGPQMITRRGVEAVVVLSVEDYRKLKDRQTGLVDFFRASPLVGVELDLERDHDTGREVDL